VGSATPVQKYDSYRLKVKRHSPALTFTHF
jgi:hypothetical protein